jgi:hypothetical protein
MTDAVKMAPDIIKAASASPLGILALLVLVLGFLAYVYFKSAPLSIRIGIFAALLLGASLYAVAITNAAQKKGADGPTSQTVPNGVIAIDGTVADTVKGDSIALAAVTTALSASPAITDSNGVFHLKIKTPDPGESVVLVLHVAKSGYESLDWTVTPPIVGAIRILLKKVPTAANVDAPKHTGEIHKSDLAAKKPVVMEVPTLSAVSTPPKKIKGKVGVGGPAEIINSAPNGIAIAGGTVTNPTVNNYGLMSRRLTANEENNLQAALSSSKARVIIWFFGGDDTQRLAQDFYDVFHGAGWEMAAPYPEGALQVEPQKFDIALFLPASTANEPASAATIAVVDAMKALQMHLSLAIGTSANIPGGSVKLVVGPRWIQ